MRNHEAWSICPNCGGWYDMRWGVCGCGKEIKR